MRRAALAALTAFLLAGPALAGEGATQVPSSTVLLSPVPLPVVVNGRVVNYVFTTLRLGLSPRADATKMRDMEPYFRDALVRAGHRTPFVRPDNYAALDNRALTASVLRDAAALVGPGMVVSVQIVREQAQHFSGLPPTAVPARR